MTFLIITLIENNFYICLLSHTLRLAYSFSVSPQEFLKYGEVFIKRREVLKNSCCIHCGRVLGKS